MGNGFDIAFISGPDGVGIRSLGALSGDRFSHATGINNSGQVTDFSELHPTYEDHSGIPRAFLSEPNGGPLHDIASLAGAESAGIGVNNVGQVTGYAILPAGLHAFLSGVNGSAIKDLGNFNGPGAFTMALLSTIEARLRVFRISRCQMGEVRRMRFSAGKTVGHSKTSERCPEVSCSVKARR